MAVPKGFDVPFRMVKEGCSPSIVEGDSTFDRSIKTIIQTLPGERPYRPTFGCFAKAVINENMSQVTAIQAGDEIRRALREWEPRITVEDVLFELDNTTIFLTINYRVNGRAADASTTLNFGL